MRSAEYWVSSEFGFDYIDDVKPQTRTAFGTTRLLKQIESIQRDALMEAAEIVNQSIAHELNCDWVEFKNAKPCSCGIGMITAGIRDAILKRVEKMETHNPTPTNR